MELNLSGDVKDNKNGPYEYMGDTRKTRENVGSLQNKVGDLVTQDMKKTEVLNTFFDSENELHTHWMNKFSK